MKAKLPLYFAFLGLFLTLSSCVTYKRCQSKYPSARDTIRITTVRDSIVYRDTTIFIKIPGESVHDSVPIPCPEVPGYIPKRVYAETSLAKASAWWSFPNIKLELIQKDTTIERRLDNAIKEAFHWKSEFEKITVIPEPEKYIPKIVKVFAWVGGLSLLSFVLFIAYKIIKR